MQAALKEIPDHPIRPVRVTEHKSKGDMLILATNRFCDIDTHDRLKLDQFSEAFNLLIGQVSSTTRQIVSRRLAHCPFTPRSAALYLALEPIEVAMPILAHCEALGQLDLLRIMDRTGIEHARAVATRLDIGPSLIRHLKGLEDKEVQIALEDNDALLGNLETRGVNSLFNEIENRELQYELETEIKRDPVEESGEAEPAQITERLEKMPFTPAPAPLNAAEHALLAAAGRGSRLEMPPMATPMENEFDFGEAFEKMARSRSHQGMAVLMQKRFSLSLDTAHQVLQDKTGDTLAVLLSAANVKPAQANRIQLLTHPAIGLSSHNALRAVRFYAQLNSESSLAAVEQWPKARDPQIRHEALLEDGRETHLETRTEGREVAAATAAASEPQDLQKTG